MPTGRGIFAALKYVVLIFFAVIALIPFMWMISSSFKTSASVFTIPMRWIPETLHFENFVVIWERVPLLQCFINTTAVAIAVTLMQILTSSFAAYAFAKMRFRVHGALFFCILEPWRCRGRCICFRSLS